MLAHSLNLAGSLRELAVLERRLLGEVGDVGIGALFLLEEVLFDELEAILPVLVALF